MPSTLPPLLTVYPPNRYAATCRTCGTEVIAGEGRIRHGATGWIVAHLIALCPDPPTTPAEPIRIIRPRGADGRFTKS